MKTLLAFALLTSITQASEPQKKMLGYMTVDGKEVLINYSRMNPKVVCEEGKHKVTKYVTENGTTYAIMVCE